MSKVVEVTELKNKSDRVYTGTVVRVNPPMTGASGVYILGHVGPVVCNLINVETGRTFRSANLKETIENEKEHYAFVTFGELNAFVHEIMPEAILSFPDSVTLAKE